MKLIQIIEAFENWHYSFPKDKEQQLYDFYVLSMVGEPFDMDLNAAYKDAMKTLLPSLKKELLDAVYYAIISEAEYFTNITFINYPKLSRTVYQILLDIGVEMRPLEDKWDFHNVLNEISEKQFRRVALSTPYREKVVQFAKLVFPYIKQSQGRSYGGKNWINICDAWLALNDATQEGPIIAAIDHIYDLQHNTNTVFDKVKSYYKNGGFDWLTNALDIKANTRSIYELLPYIQSDLKNFVAAVMKDKKGSSIEEFETKIGPQAREENKAKLLANFWKALKLLQNDPDGLNQNQQKEYKFYKYLLQNVDITFKNLETVLKGVGVDKTDLILSVFEDYLSYDRKIKLVRSYFDDLFEKLLETPIEAFDSDPFDISDIENKYGFEKFLEFGESTSLITGTDVNRIKNEYINSPRLDFIPPEKVKYIKKMIRSID